MNDFLARLWLLLGVCASGAFGQAVIEDFRCQVPLNITPGNPTLVSCQDTHGFEAMRASAILNVGTPRPGDSVTINEKTYRFVTDLGGCQPNDVLMASAANYGNGSWVNVNSAYHLAAAVNG